MNEPALLAMIEALHGRVAGALSEGRFPFVYGADCTVLLEPCRRCGMRWAAPAWCSLDATEDTTSLDASPDGEAANMEIGLLLGLTGHLAPERLRRLLPAVQGDALAMLGTRDDALRRELNVASLADRDVLLRRPRRSRRTRQGPGTRPHHGRPPTATAGGCTSTWTSSRRASSHRRACRATETRRRPDLATARPDVLGAALAVGGCRGVQHRDLRPRPGSRRWDARRIVQLVRDLQVLTRGTPDGLFRFAVACRCPHRRESRNIEVVGCNRGRRGGLRIVCAVDDYLYTNEHCADGTRRSIFSGPNREKLMGGSPRPAPIRRRSGSG